MLGTNINTLIASALTSALLAFVFLNSKKIEFPKFLTSIMFVLIIWLLICTFFSQDIGSSIWQDIRFLAFLTAFITAYNLTRRNGAIATLLLSLLSFAGGLVITFDLVNYLLKNGLNFGQQLAGSLGWHNQEAGLVLILLPLLIALSLKVKNLLLKLILAFLSMFLILTIFLTSSRAGLLVLSIQFFVFLIIALRKSPIYLKLLLCLVGVLIILGSFLIKVNTNDKIPSLGSEIAPGNRSLSGNLRLDALQNSLKIIKDYPIFGIGPGSFGIVYPQYQTQAWLYTSRAHNHLLQTAVELGLPGLILFSSVIVFSIYVCFKKRAEIVDKKNVLLLGVVVALLGSFLHALVDVDWQTLPLFLIFWLLLGVLMAKLTEDNASINILGNWKLIYLAPLLILGISTLLVFSELSYFNSRIYIDEGDLNLAERAVKQAIFLYPLDSRYYFNLGEIELRQKNLDASQKEYQKTTTLDPLNAQGYYYLGIIEFQKGHYQKAREMFLQATKLDKYSQPNIYTSLADSYIKLADFKNAQAVLEDAINNKFPLNDAFYGFEYIYNYVGLKKDLATTYFRLAQLYMQNGQTDKAQQLLGIVETKLDPESPFLPLLKTQAARGS